MYQPLKLQLKRFKIVLFLFGMVGVGVIMSQGWSGFMSFVTSNHWLGLPMAIGLIPVLILLPLIILVVVIGIAQGGID